MGPKMKSLEEIKKISIEHKEELRKKFKVKELGIFGSYVKKEEKRESDIDVLVTFEKPIVLFEFIDLEEYLENLLETKVDLVSKKGLLILPFALAFPAVLCSNTGHGTCCSWE